ncbi:MAG: adenylyltransferase/cytidyltransferase family protein [Opitutae bacterium]|nr:adenylyltransferase/cytidyltransferase family protein [Opitutae bacterium]
MPRKYAAAGGLSCPQGSGADILAGMENDDALARNPKLFKSLDDAVARRKVLAREGKKIVLTNGCFDLLHCGHVYYLREAAKLGDELWIGLNGAESVRALKGATRPVQGDLERAFTLAALEFVAGIFLFHTPRLDAEIRLLRPDVYAKAGDYTLETLNPAEREALQSCGAEIRFLPFLPGFSTTNLIKKIAAASVAGAI